MSATTHAGVGFEGGLTSAVDGGTETDTFGTTSAPAADTVAGAGGSRPRIIIDLEAHSWTLTQDDLLLLAILAGVFGSAILAFAEVVSR